MREGTGSQPSRRTLLEPTKDIQYQPASGPQCQRHPTYFEAMLYTAENFAERDCSSYGSNTDGFD